MNRAVVIKVLKFVGTWLPTGMLVFVFTSQGLAKFDATSGWARAFEVWGYPEWFRQLIGVQELLAAALLVWPRTAPIGAALVIITMLGGIGTHIAANDRWWFRSESGPILFATIVLLFPPPQIAALAAMFRGARSNSTPAP